MRMRHALNRYLVGSTSARTGDEMSTPALLLAGLAATGSTASASSLLAAVTIAAALGGPLFGVLLDRSARPNRLLAGALGGYALALALILTSLGHLPIAATILIAIFAGLLGPALAGGWTAQLPRVVPGDRLIRATAYDAMTYDLAGLLGPALAGIVAGLVGASAAVAVSAALIAAAVPAAWSLPKAPRTPPTQAARPQATISRVASVRSEIRAGSRAILQSPLLARATATSVITCMSEGMLVTCCPLLGARLLGGADHGAILLSGMAVTGLTANAALSRWPRPPSPDTIMWCSTLIMAAALLLAASDSPIPVIIAILTIGAALGPQLTALFAIRHREAPDHLRSQIFTTGASLKTTGFALGAAITGPLTNRSPSGALIAAAGIAALAVAAFAAISAAD